MALLGARGQPVVKEYQEEYFCRIAIILDTFVPRRPGARDTRAFEAAISVVASIADFFSRSEHIVDILAAGPDIYEVSAGRSLAYLENILDVLACLEPCPEPPFRSIGPLLFEKLGQITTVVAVLHAAGASCVCLSLRRSYSGSLRKKSQFSRSCICNGACGRILMALSFASVLFFAGQTSTHNPQPVQSSAATCSVNFWPLKSGTRESTLLKFARCVGQLDAS